MHITDWKRTSEHCSIGSAAGEGLHYRFVVLNSDGEITHPQQLMDDEWLAVAEPAPMFLRTLSGRTVEARSVKGNAPWANHCGL